jgi:hypothetical protein
MTRSNEGNESEAMGDVLLLLGYSIQPLALIGSYEKYQCLKRRLVSRYLRRTWTHHISRRHRRASFEI